MILINKWIAAVFFLIFGYAIETYVTNIRNKSKIKWPLYIVTFANGIWWLYFAFQIVTGKVIFFCISMM